ncbi:MAG: DUF456 domain-containing protein [Planctomycetia bacterium]|nr:DUF456 domain-containing protein [Planctomycetia bacterium]
MGSFWYYTLAVLFVIINIAALCTNLITLPGNWIIVVAAVLFAWLVKHPSHPSSTGLNWWVVGLTFGLAVLGEIIEFAAGAAGAAKSGGSRRGMLLSMAGAMLGSITGTMLGTFIPIPLVGNLIGAVAGGAAGAFGGAYAGEYWKGKSEKDRLTVSSAAMVGRVFGTVGKLGIGAIMVVVTAVDVFYN